MANKKISEDPILGASSVDRAADYMPIVDASEPLAENRNKRLLLNSVALTAAALTSGRIPFASTGDLLADSANLQWSAANNQLLLGDGSATNPAYSFASEATLGIFRPFANTLRIQNSVGACVDVDQAKLLVFGGILQLGGSDATLVRDAANTLAQRNGVTAQAFRLYNTFTDASNHERFSIFWNASVLFLHTENAGTGANRALDIGGAGIQFTIPGLANVFKLQTTGHLTWNDDNTKDIGAVSATRPRSGYFGTSVLAPFARVDNSAVAAAVADSVQVYSSDDAAGHTIPSFQTEGTNVLATGQADSASSVRVKMRINGTVVTLLAI